MKKFSTTYKSSKKPKKQRLYRYNAPLHIKGKFLSVHLSKDLAKKFSKRAIRVRTGDRVKIMAGQFKGQTGKVEEVDTKRTKVYVAGMEIQKKDGTKTRYPITPSNLMISELSLDDKKRQEILKRK